MFAQRAYAGIIDSSKHFRALRHFRSRDHAHGKRLYMYAQNMAESLDSLPSTSGASDIQGAQDSDNGSESSDIINHLLSIIEEY